MFLGKAILKICSKFIGEHPCRSAISIKCDFKCMIFGFVKFDRGEFCDVQEKPPRGNPRKSCSENLQQIYRRTPPIALRHGCSPVNLLHIFRTAFPRNTSGWLLLDITELTPIKYDESENHTFDHLYILKGNHFLMSPNFRKAM